MFLQLYQLTAVNRVTVQLPLTAKKKKKKKQVQSQASSCGMAVDKMALGLVPQHSTASTFHRRFLSSIIDAKNLSN
jgi:hypothetical protein